MRYAPPCRRVLLAGLLVLAGCGGGSASDNATADAPPAPLKEDVEQTIASLNEMREALAATIDTPTVGKATFERVCKPVGQRAQQISAERGWAVQQLAKKHRNPAHALDEEARRLYKQFANSPDLTDTWIRTARDGRKGWRYARRISVESSCLACHGPKEQRPDFIKTGYPDDRAYGFAEGDLRGLYSVFVPTSSADTTTASAF